MAALEEGDEVITSAGIYGRITALDDEIAILEVADGVELRIARGAIARRLVARTNPIVDLDEPEPIDEAELVDRGRRRRPGGRPVKRRGAGSARSSSSSSRSSRSARTLAASNSPQLGLDLQGGVLGRARRPRATRPSDSIDKAKEIIRQRVDGLGVAEPEITRQGDNVVVQLPGVKDRKKAQQIVGQTAKLEFRPGARRSGARRATTYTPAGPDEPGPDRARCVTRTTTTTTSTTTTTGSAPRPPTAAGADDRSSTTATTATHRPTTTARPTTDRHRPRRPTVDDHDHHDRRRPSDGGRRPRSSRTEAAATTPRAGRACQARPGAASRASSLSRAKAELDTDHRLVEGGGRHQGQPRRRRPTSCSTPASPATPPSAPRKQAAIVLDGQVQSYPDRPGPEPGRRADLPDHRRLQPVRGQGPGARAALRRAAGRVRAQRRAAGVGHARQGLARRRPRSPASSASPPSPSTCSSTTGASAWS